MSHNPNPNPAGQDLAEASLTSHGEASGPAGLGTASAAVEKFKQLVRDHDLTYDYSDDGAVWRAGVAQRDEIRALAKELPTGEAAAIWNAEVDRKITESSRAMFYWREPKP